MDDPSIDKPKLGRPGLVVANRPEVCSKGHKGSITLWGRRDWRSAPHRRQRFRCVPPDGSNPHTFSLGRRRPSDAHGHGSECLTCDVKPGVAQGPISPPDHLHTAIEIAHMLQLVAQGMSLQRASRTIGMPEHFGMRRGSGGRVWAPHTAGRTAVTPCTKTGNP